MTYATARAIGNEAIPVVDLTGLRSGRDTATVARALHAASTGLGFIYVVGHGIADATINAARDSAYAFFHSSDALKTSVLVSPHHRGWLKPGAAKMHDKARPDLKESFIWGYQENSEHWRASHPLRGPNQWPAWVPGMQDAAMAYFNSAHAVAFDLMRGFALGLNLPENFFLKTCSQPLSRASYVYYPAQDESCGEEQFGVAPHTDFGVLTVLCQDNTGGLQVQDINGDWLEAPPLEGSLVINVGDLLSRWTGGIYRSTVHRVVNSSGRERLSLVLAFDPDPHTLIDPSEIPAVSQVTPQVTSHTATEPAITCGDYLLWRFEKAFSYRKADTHAT